MDSNENQLKAIDEEEDCMFAMQLASASVLPMVMQAAIELDVLEIIARAGPSAQISPSQIASQLPTQNPEAPIMLDRILRLLTSYSVLTCSIVTHESGHVERLYGLAPVCKYFLRNEDGVSISTLMNLIQDKAYLTSWYHLKDSILDGGIPFNKAHGVHTFEYAGIDPRFEDLHEVVDVGGGLGTTISIITSKYPSIKGINFDLPHVIEHGSSYPGVEHVGGDMFASVPKGEAIFMEWILHDWSEEHCLTLLKNCYKAVPDNGKVIVVEGIHPVAPETNAAAKVLCQLDLILLAQAPGGKERTEKEFDALAKGAGFVAIKKVCCVFNYWVMEFYKTI